MKKLLQISLTLKILLIILLLLILFVISMFAINAYVISVAEKYITDPENAAKMSEKYNADCIIILGAGVDEATGTPSHMLKDRLNVGVKLYKENAAPKMLMSGDHGRYGYDEVNVMKKYAIARGVPSEDIFMDHAGFSTYETMYRAKQIFEVKSAVIVTQKYHMYRAIYIAKRMGIDCYGVNSDPIIYSSRRYNDMRETLSRVKDSVYCIFKPKPKFLGEKYPISGNGNATNDR